MAAKKAAAAASGEAIATERTSAVQALAAFWQRLRSSPRLKGGFLYAIVAALVVALATIPTPPQSTLADTDRLAFDAQMRILRKFYPRPLANDIVLIGIDEDTYDEFPEPIALWHKHYARMLHALAKAKPRAVAVDVVLPERSYDSIMPGSDLALMRALLDMKRSAPLVYV